MLKADESDCEVSDTEAEKWVLERAKDNPKAVKKVSNQDIKELKMKKVKAKKDRKLEAMQNHMKTM